MNVLQIARLFFWQFYISIEELMILPRATLFGYIKIWHASLNSQLLSGCMVVIK